MHAKRYAAPSAQMLPVSNGRHALNEHAGKERDTMAGQETPAS